MDFVIKKQLKSLKKLLSASDSKNRSSTLYQYISADGKKMFQVIESPQTQYWLNHAGILGINIENFQRRSNSIWCLEGKHCSCSVPFSRTLMVRVRDANGVPISLVSAPFLNDAAPLLRSLLRLWRSNQISKSNLAQSCLKQPLFSGKKKLKAK